MKKLTVSIIIPVHNGGINFRRCLESVVESSPSPQEIIIVSDGDADRSWQMANEFDAKVLRIDITGGPARARNLGALEAKGDILFFVDDDVAIAQDAVAKIFLAFQHDPDLAAIFGSYDDEPFEKNFLSQYKNLFHYYIHQTSKEDASTFWGACGAIRRDIFQEIGGFNDGYRHPSIEDIELGYRLKKAGYRIRLLKDLKVKHLKRWGIVSLLKADFFYRALPWADLILNENRFPDDLNLKISNRISVMSVYILIFSLLGGPFLSWLFLFALFLTIALLILNWDLYRSFKDRRGIFFVLKTIPWHWFYFGYSGLAFSIALVKYGIKRFTPIQ